MGEKIRDIHPIKIGNSQLMIELNEGYSPSDGRLIHIQNKKYRFLLKEKDFRHLCAIVMRSWSEFVYIKNKKIEQMQSKDFSVREPLSSSMLDYLYNLCGYFKESGLKYRILDLQNRLITVIIDESERDKFRRIIRKLNGKEDVHPYSERNGYVFLYLMKPFQLFIIDDVYIEVFCQLPCASLTPKNWIPLDKMIQQRIWQFEEVKNGVSWLDDISRYIYHLCWAVFHNHGFSPYEIDYLKDNKSVLKEDEMHKCLSMVFFNYTDELITYLDRNDFENIIPNYFSFKKY